MSGQEQTLRAVLVGAGGFGARTLEAISQCSQLELVALSDRDAGVAQAAGERAGVEAYTDNRSLLAEARPDVAFLCVPPHAAPDLVAACAERGIHVWKELPLARHLAEGVSMVNDMQAAGLKFAVGTQHRFLDSYRHGAELVDGLGEIFLARAHYLFNWGPDLRWRADRATAGGGALLELAYHPLDLLIWLLGVPEAVFGAAAQASGKAMRRSGHAAYPPHDTDDTAAAVLRYRSGLTATVVTTRCSGPFSEELSIHGQGGSLRATQDSCLLRDPDGQVIDQFQQPPLPLQPFARQVEAFAAAVAGGAERYACSAWENLLTLAVIEALYLSQRTGQQENVPALLNPYRLTPADCRRCALPAQPGASRPPEARSSELPPSPPED